MRFWFREIAGWALVGLGLCIFLVVYALCTHEPEHRYMEAMTMTVIGIFVFRGGINVLKTAVAARICQQAQDRLYPAPLPPARPVAGPRPATPQTPGWPVR
jgi:hypothetical protein